jgi:hypothetical protein
MSESSRPDCHILAKSFCSRCGREQYCGCACQKQDWKIHKSMCPIVKNFSNTLRPYDEVVQVIKEILASKKGDDIRIFEHLLLYADYQFGKPIIGKIIVRGRMVNESLIADVDIGILLIISNTMVDVFTTTSSLSNIIRDKEMLPHIERSIHILSPWMDTIDSDASHQSNSLNSEMTDYLLKIFVSLERNLANLATNRRQFDLAERYTHRCLVNSRRFQTEGEEKTT